MEDYKKGYVKLAAGTVAIVAVMAAAVAAVAYDIRQYDRELEQRVHTTPRAIVYGRPEYPDTSYIRDDYGRLIRIVRKGDGSGEIKWVNKPENYQPDHRIPDIISD